MGLYRAFRGVCPTNPQDQTPEDTARPRIFLQLRSVDSGCRRNRFRLPSGCGRGVNRRKPLFLGCSNVRVEIERTAREAKTGVHGPRPAPTYQRQMRHALSVLAVQY